MLAIRSLKHSMASMVVAGEFRQLLQNSMRKAMLHSFSSTRGASKQRRDQINQELAELRQLLPLEQGTRERLFQLQVMSLCCCYIRKQHLLGALLNGNGQKVSATETAARNAFAKQFKTQFLSASTHVSALHENFLLVVTGQGQLLALSDNFSQDTQITTAHNFC